MDRFQQMPGPLTPLPTDVSVAIVIMKDYTAYDICLTNCTVTIVDSYSGDMLHLIFLDVP